MTIRVLEAPEAWRRAWLDLGLTNEQMAACRLPLCREAQTLTSIGQDTAGRERQATPATCEAWHRMRAAATGDGVVLEIVSAYRSFEYQCDLLQRKMDSGIPLPEIITVNAIPGFSEHHTGRALDLTTPDAPELETEFEDTPAFVWLSGRAAEFGFSMTYPRDNDFGITYEPWHWCYQGSGLPPD